MQLLPDALNSFFKTADIRNIAIEPLTGDASARKYFRLRSPDRSWILCFDPQYRDHNAAQYPFLDIQRLFSSHSIPVPGIIGRNKEQGFILQEDCGDILLQDALKQQDTDLASLYCSVVDIMVSLQSIRGKRTAMPFDRAFDEEKLMFEFTFFLDNVSRYEKRGFSDKETVVLKNDFSRITQHLVKPEHFVLNHRDYHSRNILVTPSGPVIIDFQDARLGLPQYDAVSLLRDSYVTLDEPFVHEMQQHHYLLLKGNGLTTMSFDEYLRLFDLMAFQRNVKALGTFFNQACSLGKNEFLQYIDPTLAYLPGYIERQPELRESGAIILNLLQHPKP